MTSKKIYIIRHGQTDFNLKGIVQGSGVNSSLNDTGKDQARAFYESYRNIPFQKIYTSALQRTIQSVDLFIKDGIPYQSLSELNEISWGAHEGKAITPEEDKYYHWILDQWRLGNTHLTIVGGESPEEVMVRQCKAIRMIMDGEEDTVLISMHGRAMRIILCQLLNYPLKSMDIFEHQNLGLYLLHFTGSMFSVKKHNDVNHLKNMEATRKVAPAVSRL